LSRAGFEVLEQRIFLNLEAGQPTRGGPPAWGLGEVLTTPPCKTFMLRNTYRHDASSGDKAIRR